MAVIVASIAMLVLAVGAWALFLYSVMQDRAASRQRIQRRLDRL